MSDPSRWYQAGRALAECKTVAEVNALERLWRADVLLSSKMDFLSHRAERKRERLRGPKRSWFARLSSWA